MANPYLVRPLEPGELNRWDQIVENSLQGSVYTKSYWFSAVANIFKIKYKIYGCFKGEELVGGTGVFYTRRWNKKIALKPSFTPYTGLVIKRNSQKAYKEINLNLAVTEELSKSLEKEYAYLKFAHHWGLQDIRSFNWRGWDTEVRYTFTVSLENLEEIYAGIDRRDRKPVERAARLGYTCSEGGDWAELYRLLELTYAKQNLPPPMLRKTYFQFIDNLRDLDILKLFLVKNPDQEIVAGSLVLADKTGPQGWIAGADPAHLNTGVGAFLYWEMFRKLAGQFKVFDLNGANIKSISSFKENMGGQLKPYFITSKINSPLLKAFKLLKELPGVWK